MGVDIEGFRQLDAIFLARDFAGTELAQMIGRELRIEQPEPAAA